jgi:tetratricopeptide (TPR) repeat protein/anti-sigma regulatory factor (Ser/Thr protein kinase)
VDRILSAAVVVVLLCACGDGHVGTPQKKLLPSTEDSLIIRQLDSAKTLLRVGESDSAEAVVRRAVKRAAGDRAHAKSRIATLAALGRVLQRKARPDTALVIYREGLAIAEQLQDTVGMGAMWVNIGTAYEDLGRYAQALDAQLNALRWKELANDERNMAATLHNLSVLYWRQDSLDQAINHLQRSIGLKRKYDELNLGNGLNGLGVLLIEARQYDEAITVLKESMVMDRQLGTEVQAQIANIALAFENNGQLDSAEVYYTLGLKEARAKDDPLVVVRTLYGLGDVRRAQGRYAEAGRFLDSALALAHGIGSREDIKEAHHSLAQLYEFAGDPASALVHLKAYHHMRDSLMSADTEAAMNELRLRYDTERKDRENAELRTAAELTGLRAERNRWVAVGIGVLATAIAALSWTVIQRNRERARQREAELEQQALRLQMDPHFLFNALNTVPGLYASGDTLAANDHVGHLSRFLRLVLETSRRRTIPLEQEIELVEHYLRISANRKPGCLSWSVKVMPYVQPERVAIPPMLIQPIVENAIEHGINGSGTGHVDVLVDRAGSVLHIEVRDNGVGRSAAARRPVRRNSNSMGMDLVRKRIALFDRQTTPMEAVEVRDEVHPDGTSKGTTVILRMRIQQLNEHAAAGDRG